MREAFGGGFMIRLVLVFIVIYICFMAVAVNYARAFRVKNHLINLIVQTQYKTGGSVDPFEKYLDSVNYIGPYDSVNRRNSCEGNGGVWLRNGACITRVGSDDKCYYQVTTFITIDVPLITKMSLSVKGETKTYTY